METVRIETGQLESVNVLITNLLGGVTGLADVNLSVRRDIDGFWLDFDDNTFKDSGWIAIQQVMAEVDATNDSGAYRHIGTATNWTDVWGAGAYHIRVDSASQLFVATGEIKIGGYVDSLARILGLSHENTYHHTRIYNDDSRLISGKVDIYNSKTNAELHDGETGLVASYTITTVPSGLIKITSMLVVREP